MPEFNPTFHIPGPGAAMALAAAASIYSAAIVDTSFTKSFLLMTVFFIIATLVIEYMHIIKDKIKARYTKDIFLILLIVIIGIGLTHFICYLLLN